MAGRTGIITLTTDFGTRDAYVGAMRGAALARNPSARLYDITHEVPPQDIRAGARILAAACPWYPAGTVHLVVVDPGVGTQRAGLVVEAGGHIFVGPDNGVIAPAAARLGEARAYRIEDRALLAVPQRGVRGGGFLAAVSRTFHGRDVFAPVAGALSAGLRPEQVGPPHAAMAALPPDVEPVVVGGVVHGVVEHVDRFGNLVTNVPGHLLPAGEVEVRAGTRLVARRLVATYGEARPGEALIALVGSEEMLEIASPGGSAAELLDLGRGALVEVRPCS